MILTQPDRESAFPQITGRILVFIVAYEAQKHISDVLNRVPKQLWTNPDLHFLVIDDASSDRSINVAADWAKDHGVPNLTALRNPVNQGYGGNQKLGYRIAIEAGCEFVVLLHGDGQYAPELLPQFIEIWKTQNADVVLGSRMQNVKNASAGGMPWYKVIGNRVLTTIQNKLTGQNLSEYHTGYRGYSTKFLKAVPFEVDTNEFHFDTEILLQAFHVGAKVVEFPIPTHYGDEICRVPHWAYAKNVILETLQFKMHRMGMMCSLKYRHLEPLRYRDKTTALFTSHRLALDEVKRLQPKSVLDLGCGPGFVSKECEKTGAKVTGIDAYDPLPEMMSDFHRANLETDSIQDDIFDYDVILLLDVIEHLADPERFLLDLRNGSQATGQVRKLPTMIISTPNIAFAGIRMNMLLGRFSYAERGILDITHKRLFTKWTLLRTLKDCGYLVEKFVPVPVPFAVVMPNGLGRLLGWFSNVLANIWPSMFAFQSMVVCKPLPGVHQLISQSEKHLAQSAA